MALSPSFSLTNGGTISVTGGTSKTFTVVENSGSFVAAEDLSVTDMRIRPRIEIRKSVPAVSASAPNGYSQFHANVVVKLPKLLANGKVTMNTIRFSVNFDFETTDAEKQYMVDIMSQFAFNTALKPAVKDGAL